MMSDHTSYNFKDGNGDPTRKLSVFFNAEMTGRGYHAYQSMWVAVSEELPCQNEKVD